MRLLDPIVPRGLLLLATGWLLAGCPLTSLEDTLFACSPDGGCDAPDLVCSRERLCQPASQVLRLEQPREGARVGPSGLTVEAFLDVDGDDPPSLSLEVRGAVAGEPLTVRLERKGPGAYAGHWTPEPSWAGRFTLRARDDARGFLSPDVTVEVDLSAPPSAEPVMREKWALDLGADITSPPLVDTQGTVYVARGAQVRWFDPQGHEVGHATTEGLFGPPALMAVGPVSAGGRRLLYFVERTQEGWPRLVALDPSNGNRVASCEAGWGSVLENPSLALGTGQSSQGQTLDVALAAFRSEPGWITYLALRPGDVSSCLRGRVQREGLDNLLASGSRFFAVTRTDLHVLNVLAARLEMVATTECPNAGMSLLVGQKAVGLWGVNLFSFDFSAGNGCTCVDVSGPAGLSRRTSSVIADAAGRVFFGKQGADQRPYLSRVSLGPDPVEVAEVSGDLSPALVLGQGGRIHGTSADGQWLQVWTTDLQPLREWKGPFQVSLATTLDCARDSTGQPTPSRTGLWYVPDGRWLRALVVDSRGIDADAPWPLSRHDPQGSGNALTSLEPFRCPPPLADATP